MDECENDTSEMMMASSRKRRHVDSSLNDNASDMYGDSYENLLRRSLDILERAQSPNFEELARQYPNFRAAWAATKSSQKNKGHATFSSCVTQDFSIQLTRAILQALFRLKLPYLDEDHLCPPVPNRFFYLHWIHTKLMSVSWAGAGNDATTRSKGLDIGSGASCIYSMLAARFFRSSMITTEIDPKSIGLARANVEANHLSSMITILQVPPSCSQQQQHQQRQNNNTTIGGPLQRSIEGWFFHCQQHPCANNNFGLDFVMTNPPFYDPSSMELSTARVGDGRSRTNMTVSEGNYPGGEIGFVTEMVEDSLRMTSDQCSITWYSSMLGKKTSLVRLQKMLVHILGSSHVETIEYGPGHYTRWFLAWTLQQPPIDAGGALCDTSEKDAFKVHIDEPALPEIALKEVANRIAAFCDSGPGGWDLTTSNCDFIESKCTRIVLRILENMPPSVDCFVDENQKGVEIPESILHLLRGRDNSDFLPEEGHFMIEVELVATPVLQQCVGTVAVALVLAVDVQLRCYKHSLRGQKAIEKIRNSLEGEVCRTNRKWRKIRQRQNQQHP